MPLNSVPRKGKRIRDGTSNTKRIKFVKGKKIGFGGGGGVGEEYPGVRPRQTPSRGILWFVTELCARLR